MFIINFVYSFCYPISFHWSPTKISPPKQKVETATLDEFILDDCGVGVDNGIEVLT